MRLAPGDRAVAAALCRARREEKETERAGARLFKGKFEGLKGGLGLTAERRPHDHELKPVFSVTITVSRSC